TTVRGEPARPRTLFPVSSAPAQALEADCRLRDALLTVGSVLSKVLGDFAFPAVTVREQAFLVIEQLFAGFRRKLEIRTLNDGIYRAGFLTEAAVDALGHVDVVPGGAAGAVLTRFGFDGDGLSRANGFAELAGNAPFLAVRVATQRVLATKTRAQRPLLVGIVDRRLLLEHVLESQGHALHEFREEELLGGKSERHRY